ncbi:helix-turn-helix transcriptional regulator [Elioraea sp.]|uniref:helix-turn-helix transcriptional regulator n=1 Tax=Elioraea sp. TaxID=2185103 RepID=UPI003F6ECC0F
MTTSVALLAPAEAARALGVSLRSLERWRTTGHGPAYVRMGPRRIAYREADLTAWLEARAFAHRAAEAAASAASDRGKGAAR